MIKVRAHLWQPFTLLLISLCLYYLFLLTNDKRLLLSGIVIMILGLRLISAALMIIDAHELLRKNAFGYTYKKHEFQHIAQLYIDQGGLFLKQGGHPVRLLSLNPLFYHPADLRQLERTLKEKAYASQV